MKALRLIIAFAAMLALTLSSAIGGSSPATAAAPAQPDQQLVVAAANPASADVVMDFSIEMLPSKKKAAPPSKCTVEWSKLVMPYEWPWAKVQCKAGSGKYRVKGTFKRIINGKSYSVKGNIVSVGKTSWAHANGPFDWATGARWMEA